MPPPKLFGGAMEFTDLAVGGQHACALNRVTAGGAHTCGRNQSAIVSCRGSGHCFQREPALVEIPRPNRPNMLDVSAGAGSSCAVNGWEVWCWGSITGGSTPTDEFPVVMR
jgi:hypothetical protein